MTEPEKLQKTICITGASAGIGAAVAEVFAEAGWSLALGARRLERLEAQASKLKHIAAKHGSHILVAPLDVTKGESVQAFAHLVHERFPKVDVLLNNAGLAIGTDHLAQVKESDWSAMIETNVIGVLRMTREFLPKMLDAHRGHIINLGSIAGHVSYEGGGVYCATKHALRALTQTLRLEVNGTGVRISTVDPGMVETEFSSVRFAGDKERAEKIYRGLTPLNGRDIAECIFFAASRPPHVNIDEIIVMPTAQAAIHKVART